MKVSGRMFGGRGGGLLLLCRAKLGVEFIQDNARKLIAPSLQLLIVKAAIQSKASGGCVAEDRKKFAGLSLVGLQFAAGMGVVDPSAAAPLCIHQCYESLSHPLKVSHVIPGSLKTAFAGWGLHLSFSSGLGLRLVCGIVDQDALAGVAVHHLGPALDVIPRLRSYEYLAGCASVIDSLKS